MDFGLDGGGVVGIVQLLACGPEGCTLNLDPSCRTIWPESGKSGVRKKPTHHNPEVNEVLGTGNGVAVGDRRNATMQESMLGTSISGFVHARLVSNCPSTAARARARWVGLFERVRATAVKHVP